MTTSQWCLSLNVGVDGELIKTFPQKFLNEVQPLWWWCIAWPYPGHNAPMTWMPRALTVTWVMVLVGWWSLMWRLSIFFLGRVAEDTVLSSWALQRKSPPVTQLSQVLILQSRTILPYEVLTNMLFWWSLEIQFPCKSEKTGLHLPWGKTLWAIECGPVQSPQLDVPWLIACPFL